MKVLNLFTVYNEANEDMNMLMTKDNTVRTIELFAGVGGFRLGLQKSKNKSKNFSIVWSNQWEPSTKTQHASDVYTARFGYEKHSMKTYQQ